MEFVTLVNSAQSGDEDAILELIRRFYFLLRRYAKKLATEDAYSDLLGDFIETIQRMKIDRLVDTGDGVFVSYIGAAVKHAYMRRSKAMRRSVSTLSFSDLSKAELDLVEEVNSDWDKYFDDAIPRATAMTDNEADVLRLIYVHGMSVGSIASEKKISRQAVNQVKKRALDKLKNLYGAA